MGEFLWVGLLIVFGIISAVSKLADKKGSEEKRTPSKEFGEYVKRMVNEAEEKIEQQASPPPVRRRSERKMEQVENRMPERMPERVRVRSVPDPKTDIGSIPDVFSKEAAEMRENERRPVKMSKEQIRQAIIWNEILEGPVSRRKGRK